MGTHPIFESDFDCLTEMPKQIREIKEFLIKARRKDAKSVKVKQNKTNSKFKVRCSKYLYTLVVHDQERAKTEAVVTARTSSQRYQTKVNRLTSCQTLL